MSEALVRHWQEQLEFAEKLRENALRELGRLAIKDQAQLPFEQPNVLPEADEYF